jgi:hypothetical protein
VGVHAPADDIRTNKAFGQPHDPGQAIRNTSSAIVLRALPGIEIWRAAVLMLSRYACDAKANSFRRAVELAAERDHAGAAI